MLTESTSASIRFLGESSVEDDRLLSPEQASAQKKERLRRLHTVHLPILRLLGFGLLSGAVFVYNQAFAAYGAGSEELSVQFAVWSLAWGFLAWPVQSLGWPRWRSTDVLLLLLDIPFLVGAVYATGGETSWMVSVLLLRAADQAPYGTRRALGFSFATVLGYAAMVGWLVVGESREVDLVMEAAKILLLLGGCLYISLTARGNDIQRRRIAHAIATSRALHGRLREALERAQAADRAKGRFLANMSHEIRTPLAAVVGVSDLLMREDLTPPQVKKVDMLRSSARSLLGVIDDVLDFSKIESGHFDLCPVDVLVSALVRDVLRLFEPRARDVGTELVAEVDDDLAIHVDEARLRQILVNLVGNALKFTARGTVRVEARKADGDTADGTRAGDDGVETDDPWWVLEVRDTGEGIEPQALATVFQAFTQVDDTAARHHGGVGLGLAICRSLAETMGGRIQVISGDLGTTFRLELPFVPAKEAPAEDGAETEWIGQLRGRVLLVEDEEVNRLVSSQVLSALGLDVTEATHGEEALALHESAEFDLVLMDCQMPVLDGYAAAAAIRAREEESGREARVPIVALTAHAFEEDRRRCLEAGMNDYLSKPVRLESLGRQLARWLPTA